MAVTVFTVLPRLGLVGSHTGHHGSTGCLSHELCSTIHGEPVHDLIDTAFER